MQFLYRRMMKWFGVEQTHPVTIQRNLKVMTPDGAALLTDLYMGDPSGRAPVILIRSPYGKGVMFASGSAYPLAARGFNVVIQCCRGTSGSTGKFDPHHDEQRDGLATIDWIKRQPWYGGVIGTYGMSYLGYTQWAVAAAAGPEVKAMAMQVTLSDFSRMTYAGDGFMLENALSWTHMVTGMKNGGLFFVRYLISMFLGRSMISPQQWKTLPLRSMDEKVIGERVDFWQDWVEHDSSRDPWWSPMDHFRTIAEVKRPIVMAAGWFDIFALWQLKDFAALRAAGCEARITIGPWRHTDDGLGRTGIREAIDWFDTHLRGEPLREQRKAVKLWLIGADEWREYDHWPPREAVAERWYLHPQRQLSTALPPVSEPDRYVYDPDDPTPSVGGPVLSMRPHSVDNTELEARADVLTYTSEPMRADCDIIGPVEAELHVSSTAASADFFVRLCDVDSDGVSKNICDGLQRVSIDGDGPQRVAVELWPTAYRLGQGHRLRVQVSSGAFPRWARNPGSGERLADAETVQRATQSIHHSPEQPSSIVLRVVPRQ